MTANERAATGPVPVVPLPARIERREGTFAITPETAIVADAQNQANARYLQNLLGPPTGFPLSARSEAPDQGNAIRLAAKDDGPGMGAEGYRLAVAPSGVTIEAPEAAGVFYGLQTLRQLLPAEVERREMVSGGAWCIPALVIEDRPRFRWRGYMLDEGRHFQGKETVLRTLDLMALQKLNVLHWHLTEDQGWRIEIKAYPRLTEIGSKRRGTAGSFRGKHDAIPHAGFYTQEQIREIIAYAAARHIMVVPEIELPGHSLSALASYPELGCTGGPFEVSPRFGIHRDVYCAGKEGVFAFLQHVLDEVLALFPAPFIHIGGDEVMRPRWGSCPDCQRRMREEGLKSLGELQVYFVNRVAGYLSAHGRRAVGWNEILHAGLAEDAVVHYWIRHRKEVVAALQGGRDVVVSSYSHAYLDHSYSFTPLSKAYAFEPVFPELDADGACHVLGLEGLMWSEWVPNRARLDYQTYPRLAALAEVGWSPAEQRDFGGFQARLAGFLPRLDELGVRYAPLEDVEPSRLKQLFSYFTLLQPQRRVRDG